MKTSLWLSEVVGISLVLSTVVLISSLYTLADLLVQINEFDQEYSADVAAATVDIGFILIIIQIFKRGRERKGKGEKEREKERKKTKTRRVTRG